jgi:DNA-binding SARP family transcriptional activator
MYFRLLGPLEVSEGERSLALGGVKQRSLLAILLLHANELVTSDRLIDQLWGATPPRTAAKSVQVYVSRLRKLLGDGRLTTRPPGYVLHVEPSEFDLARFEQLAGEARRAAPESAARKLREALALWRGPALADLAYESFAQVEVARLEEMRLAVLEQRIDTDLALGRHGELTGELEALVTRFPLRERLRCQLMLALYRSARQAEALKAYRAARRELADELGLEPSEELRRLEHAILCQDPALELPAARPGPALASGEPARDRATPPAAGELPADRSTPRPAPAGPPRAAPHGPAPDRALLVVPRALDGLDLLLRLAGPLASAGQRHELIVAGVVTAAELGAATAALAARRDELLAGGIVARTAAFSSPSRGDDVARLAAQENVALLLVDVGPSSLVGDAGVVLERAPCDVALLVAAGGPPRKGPVMVPFGAAGHDWAALELGAWAARAAGAPLRLIGAADRREDGRDASRLLADASLIVQRTTGLVAEPLLARPGRRGVASLAEDAGLLVVGLSERWRQEGLGRARSRLAEAPPCPMVLVRRGTRPGGLAPPETRTRFSWSLTGATR